MSRYFISRFNQIQQILFSNSASYHLFLFQFKRKIFILYINRPYISKVSNSILLKRISLKLHIYAIKIITITFSLKFFVKEYFKPENGLNLVFLNSRFI